MQQIFKLIILNFVIISCSNEGNTQNQGAKIKEARRFNDIGIDSLNENKYNSAIYNFTKAIDLVDTIAVVFGNRGLANYYSKNYEEALVDLNKAILLDSNNYEFYNNRALARRKLEDLNGAILDYKKSLLKSGKENPITLVNMSLVYKDLGDKENQCHTLLRAYELGYADAINLYNQNCK